ncbi:hypothetical protein DSO57_1004431 [Entomophthora muscae]|uniref:Uncharacterized protein n=1 Tax=Entomophthora muscae TaxID=34485 RepID=A0ACC2TIX8_9FUNG|nr:hypothetical protein DSO57_1004431 [Entomophthora muscae]
MVLTTEATSHAFTPFETAFIGPAHPPSASSTLSTISSPPLEDNISDPHAILSAVIVSPQPPIVPNIMTTPTFDQVQETALALVQDGCAASVTTEFPDLPANVSYNTQGTLNKLPLDVSNNMDQSDGNIKLQALSPN